MAKVCINGQYYEVHEEVAEQFSKFIRRSNSANVDLIAGIDRELAMALTISKLQEQLRHEKTSK